MAKHLNSFTKELLSVLSGSIPNIDKNTLIPISNLYFSEYAKAATCSPDPIETIDSLLSTAYWGDKKGKVGFVSTPFGIRSRLISGLNLKFRGDESILDPSSGAGLLLVEVLKEFIKDQEIYTPKISHFISHSLYGIDISPVAIESTRINLLLLLCLKFPDSYSDIVSDYQHWKSNFICGNALFDRSYQVFKFDTDSALKLNALGIQNCFSTPMSKGGFTHIIANPPYGLSRNEQIENTELIFLKKYYKDFISGKPNKYLLFLIRSLELLANNGILSMVIPNSWLGIDNAKSIRKYLIENGYITEISSYEGKEFKNVEVEVVTIILEKNKKRSLNIHNYKSSIDNSPFNTSTISNKELLATDSFQIPLSWNKNESVIWQKVKENSIALSELLDVRIALQVYREGFGTPPQSKEAVKNHIFHTRSKSTLNHIPYLEGKDLKRYQYKWGGLYLNYGPWVAEFQDIQLYTRPRIAIREVLGKHPYLIQATYLNEQFLYNRSLLHILPPKNMVESEAEELCLAVLLILNSKLGSAYIKQFGKKSQRKLFPKILAKDLRDFPIPKKLIERRSEMAKLTKQILNVKYEALEDSNNIIISELYGLTQDDSNLILNQNLSEAKD